MRIDGREAKAHYGLTCSPLRASFDFRLLKHLAEGGLRGSTLMAVWTWLQVQLPGSAPEDGVLIWRKCMNGGRE